MKLRLTNKVKGITLAVIGVVAGAYMIGYGDGYLAGGLLAGLLGYYGCLIYSIDDKE